MFRKRSLSNNMLAEPQGDTLKVGYLRKKGHVRRNWLDRWFVLTTDGLYYYKSKEVSLGGSMLYAYVVGFSAFVRVRVCLCGVVCVRVVCM